MENKKYKVGVIGKQDVILPFKIIGFDTYPISLPDEAPNLIRKLAHENYGIIYITEDIAELIPETIAYYDKKIVPALILIPTQDGSKQIALKRVEKNVEKAVGQNIL